MNTSADADVHAYATLNAQIYLIRLSGNNGLLVVDCVGGDGCFLVEKCD